MTKKFRPNIDVGKAVERIELLAVDHPEIGNAAARLREAIIDDDSTYSNKEEYADYIVAEFLGLSKSYSVKGSGGDRECYFCNTDPSLDFEKFLSTSLPFSDLLEVMKKVADEKPKSKWSNHLDCQIAFCERGRDANVAIDRIRKVFQRDDSLPEAFYVYCEIVGPEDGFSYLEEAEKWALHQLIIDLQ